jgi:hypothetical protein
MLRPELVDQSLDRDTLVRMAEDMCKQGTLLGWAELDGLPVKERLDRAEKAQLNPPRPVAGAC